MGLMSSKQVTLNRTSYADMLATARRIQSERDALRTRVHDLEAEVVFWKHKHREQVHKRQQAEQDALRAMQVNGAVPDDRG